MIYIACFISSTESLKNHNKPFDNNKIELYENCGISKIYMLVLRYDL